MISYPAGVTRMGFKRYLLFSLLGILPFTWALIVAGLKLGQNWETVHGWFQEFKLVLAAAAALFLLLPVIRHLRRRAAASHRSPTGR